MKNCDKLKKFEDGIKKDVGAEKLEFGEISGKIKDKLDFEGKTIEIGFEKTE